MVEGSKGDFQPPAGEVKFSSRDVYQSEGVPNDPAVIAAVDKWANVWGDKVLSFVNHENLLDHSIPEQHAVSEELADAAGKLAKFLPGARFMEGLVLFDGGQIQLSSS